MTLLLSGVTVEIVGGLGTVAAVTELDATDSGEVPASFVATTRKV